jgi:hypothetical protein
MWNYFRIYLEKFFSDGKLARILFFTDMLLQLKN